MAPTGREGLNGRSRLIKGEARYFPPLLSKAQ